MPSGGTPLTESFVSEPGKLVRAAQFRSQHASLNALLAQRRFTEFDTTETFQGEPNSIYCIVLHSADSSDRGKVGSIEFAFPNFNANGWVERYKLFDVLVAAQAMQDTDAEQLDKAHPILKSIPKEGTGDT